MQKQTFQIGKSFIPGILFSACSAVLLLFAALIIASPVATTTNATDEPDYADGLSLVTSQVIEATIRPEDTGTLSIIKDTIVGATNSQYGYEVYISTNSDTVNDIYLNGNSENNETTQKILATSGTYAAPAALDLTNGATWGYAVAGLDNFDANYNEFSPAAASKFAAVPTSDSKQLIHSNSSAISDDTLDIYYGINADANLEPGVYKTEILYTAVPIIPPLTAKAILGDNGNLNFIYDRNTYTIGEEYTDNIGTTEIVDVFDVPTNSIDEESQPDWMGNYEIISANFAPSFYNFEPTGTAYWFCAIEYLGYISNIEYLNTGNVTTMAHMFDLTGTHAATWDIGDLGGWDVSKVEDMSYMFNSAGDDAATWDIGDIGKWNVGNVKTMENMFSGAGYGATTWNIGNLGYIDADHPGWDTSSVIEMECMFDQAGYNATTWDIGNIGSWDVSSVEDMQLMFEFAGESATTWNIGDISSWDVSNVKSMYMMFFDAGHYATTWNIGNLGYIDNDHPGWDVSNVTTMSYMFNSAGKNATTWNIGDIGSWDVSNVTDMSCMFAHAGYNAATWDIGDIGNWDVSSVEDMSNMYYEAGYNATTWNIGNLGYIDTNHQGWNVGSVTNMSHMFNSAGKSATTWNIGNIGSWDVSKVTKMGSMFRDAGYEATSWNIGSISAWNVSSVTGHSDFINVNANSTNLSVVNNQPNWQ